MNKPGLTISVVVCTRDRPADLLRCLESLGEQIPLPDEVVIVSGSKGSCPADLHARHFGFPVRVVECYEDNISKARNAGLGGTATDLVAFLDDDAVARAGWVGAWLEVFGAKPAVWVAGGDVYDSRVMPRVLEFCGGVVSRCGKQIAVLRDENCEPPRVFLPNVKGCNFAVRREAILGLGGFDPFFAFAFDEADLVMCAHEAGGVVVHEHGAVVEHAHTPGHYRQSGVLARDWRVEYASHTMFMLKHTRGRSRWRGRWVVRRRWMKLCARVVLGVVRRDCGAGEGILMLREAQRGILEARVAFSGG